ncbi:hypothetical protein EU546_00415 [Candidatus Thorarchaeota archaeon]|nr:MAG: hypothetical protein EU546_00415 [Candidatus Thorarchaeota archaeon]
MKQLSRKPFVLMLKDDSGEVEPIPMDLGMVNSDNALIVLDEYNDTCWVWIGRNVNMPTRMHALRIARSIQKSGHQIGVTTIGLATSKFVEMMEKDATDSQVADSIAAFKAALEGKWSFDDRVLAYRREHEAKAMAGAPPPKPPAESAPKAEPAIVAETVVDRPPPPPKPPATSQTGFSPAKPTMEITEGDKKAAHLLLATVKNSELAYIERVEKEGTTGFKIEVPGIMVIEAKPKGNYLEISPGTFGDSDAAKKIKADYEAMIKRM